MNPPTRFSPSLFVALGCFAAPVAANTILPPGNLIALNGSGNAVLASDTAGLTIAGVAAGTGSAPLAPNDRDTVDNTNGSAGAYKVCLRLGIFRFRNSSAAPVTSADLGQPVFVEDEKTVAATTSHSVVAGVVIGLDGATGVWLCVGPVGTLPGSPTLGSIPPTPPDNSSASSSTSGTV